MKIFICKESALTSLPDNYLKDQDAILFWTSNENCQIFINPNDYYSWSKRDGFTGNWKHGGWIFDIAEIAYRVHHMGMKMSELCKECKNYV